MTYEVISRAPLVDDYTSLAAHSEQTPGTFFGGKAVLHLFCPNASIQASSTDLETIPELARWVTASSGQHPVPAESDEVTISAINLWVTSQQLILFSTHASQGIAIAYPTISMHAQDGSAVLLELNLSDPNASDDNLCFLQLRLTPSETTPGDSAASSNDTTGSPVNGHSTSDHPAQILYDAISACQELNPDPHSMDDGDDNADGFGGGFDMTAPGATGWITSENVDQFTDADGNFCMPAGMTVLGGEDDELGGSNSHGRGGEDALSGESGNGRRRTADALDDDDHADEETKWQRTD